MKVIWFSLFFSSWVLASDLATEDILSRRSELTPPPATVDVAELNRLMFSEMEEQNADLKKVKYYLLNGETRLAQAHLLKLTYSQTKLKPIIYRYMAMLSFIEGKYQKSYGYLNKRELQDLTYYGKVCTLKVLNEVVLSYTAILKNEWEKCQTANFKHFKADNFIWLDTMVQMKLNGHSGTKLPFRSFSLAQMDKDQLKIFLKLAVYLSQEKLIEPQLQDLDHLQLGDTEVRELVGHIYFRLGSFAKSYRYIDDLSSPNAENIKGNLYVLRNKYELAYAQYKLALEQKQNSQNAMERILPLAWLLGDWAEGAKISQRVIASPRTQINKMALVSAFFTQKGDYKEAQKVLDTIAMTSHSTELDVTQLHGFVGLMQNDPQTVRKQAKVSCDRFDLVSCWLNLQMEQWDAFPLTIRRAEKLPAKREWERLSQVDISEPLQETAYVNQLDIEELDDRLIKLVPNAN